METGSNTTKTNKEINTLFPIFLKLEKMRVLLVGAGNVGLEKLEALMYNAPKAEVHVVAQQVIPAFAAFAEQYETVKIFKTDYDAAFIDGCDIVIAAVNDVHLSAQIRDDAHSKGKLINAADKPDLCDFYLGSIITKGNLKMAISTNGKSPTVAKRLKEVFNEMLPEELDQVLENLQKIRNDLKGNFSEKVHELNKLTQVLVEKPMSDAEKYEQYWFL